MPSNNRRRVSRGGGHSQNSTNRAGADGTDETFQQELRQMDGAVLNGLKMADYTKNQRRLIDQERCRRSAARRDAAANNQASASSSQPANGDSLAGAAQDKPAAGSQATSSAQQLPTGAPSSTNNATDAPHERPQKFYLFPEHHSLVLEQVRNISFRNNLDLNRFSQEKSTNIIGSFICSNRKCRKVWDSGVICTVIREYPRPGNKMVYNAQVFNQHCLRCRSLAFMTIDVDWYVERVARRLKIWKGEFTPEPWDKKKSTPPHKKEFCEGCKAGYCQL